MKQLRNTLFCCGIALVGGTVFGAQPQGLDPTVINTINASIGASAKKILPQAILWLGSFMAIQFILTNFALLKSGGDIEAVFGKMIGSLAWFGFCIYLINNGQGFLQGVGGNVYDTFAGNIPSPSSIITFTLKLVILLVAAVAAIGTSLVGFGNSSLAMILVYMVFIIWGIGLYFAVKLLLLQIELGLIVALAPLSFSLLGLNALKDQGIAPFKSLIALVYRIILLGILCTAFTNVYDTTHAALKALEWTVDSFGKALDIIAAAFCVFPILAFLVFKSDSIASTLAGGGSGLGTGDVATAAAAGAAAGAAVGAAASGTTGMAGRLPAAMSDVLNNMMGGGGSISNASGTGSGAPGPAPAPASAPVASAGPQSGGRSAPQFETNKAGAPQPPEAPPAQSASDAQAAQATEEKLQSQASGSGANAGIGGSNNDKLTETLEALTAQLGKPAKQGFGDRLSNLSNHLAHEKSVTQGQISPHHE